jgi:tight adherence protein B
VVIEVSDLNPLLIIALGSIFGVIVLAILTMLGIPAHSPGLDDDRVQEAEHYGVDFTDSPPTDRTQPKSGLAVVRFAVQVADRMLRLRNSGAKIAQDLDRAGLELKPQEWMAIRLSAVAILSTLMLLLSGSLLFALPIGFLIAWVPTFLYLKIKTSKRCAAFSEQLPDVLQLVASSLRSGFSLSQALDSVVSEGQQPVASEVGRALAEVRLGSDLEDALDKVGERMRCQDLVWVVMAVRISRQVGGNLAEVLVTTVRTMRERVQLRRQVRALSAEGRLSAYVLVCMPIGIGSWLFLVRREYLLPLYTTGPGVVMLCVAVLGIVVGSWWLSRIVKVEV